MLGILIVRLVLDPAVGCNDKDDADFEVIICTPLSWRFVIRTLIHDSYLPLHQKVNTIFVFFSGLVKTEVQ